jgi:hypothetical protein
VYLGEVLVECGDGGGGVLVLGLQVLGLAAQTGQGVAEEAVVALEVLHTAHSTQGGDGRRVS